MQKSPGSRALWRSGLFSLCAGALISLVLLRFLSQLDQPGLTPEGLRRSGAALALQILSISAAAIGFVTYTSLRTRSSLEQALTALTESCRIFRSAARAAGAMVFCRKAPGRELISPRAGRKSPPRTVLPCRRIFSGGWRRPPVSPGRSPPSCSRIPAAALIWR